MGGAFFRRCGVIGRSASEIYEILGQNGAEKFLGRSFVSKKAASKQRVHIK